MALVAYGATQCPEPEPALLQLRVAGSIPTRLTRPTERNQTPGLKSSPGQTPDPALSLSTAFRLERRCVESVCCDGLPGVTWPR